MLYDLTNTYFEGQCNQNPKACPEPVEGIAWLIKRGHPFDRLKADGPSLGKPVLSLPK